MKKSDEKLRIYKKTFYKYLFLVCFMYFEGLRLINNIFFLLFLFLKVIHSIRNSNQGGDR